MDFLLILLVQHLNSGQTYATHACSSCVIPVVPIITRRQLQAYITVISCDMDALSSAWGEVQRGQKWKSKLNDRKTSALVPGNVL